MHPIVRGILAIIAGLIAGSIVNMSIIMLSGYIIPPPEGVDPTDMDSMVESMHLFEAKHYLFPFLAHAIGTFAGAYTAAIIATKNKMAYAFGVGVFFLLGGLITTFMLPAPTWFIVVDLALAYLPFAWLGGKLTFR